MNAFQTLGLDAHLLQAITDLGFETPSEVQEKNNTNPSLEGM